MCGEKNQVYVSYYSPIFTEIKKNNGREELELYCQRHLTELGQLIESISKNNFWEVLPKILGIDARLNIVSELTRFDDFSTVEIIRITETDYKTYFHELCGYDLSVDRKHSIVFNVS